MIRPILFNTEMVIAILDGRKTATRRLIKFPKNNFTGEVPQADNIRVYKNTLFAKKISFLEKPHYSFDVSPPCHLGDILYVRETWSTSCSGCECCECPASCSAPRYRYRADCPDTEDKWKPSIHMPKEAARIWLKVTEVGVERLQEMNGQDILKEGINSHVHLEADYFDGNQREMFEEIWNSTIKKSDLNLFGWDANPWVWAIEFERIEKPEGWCV